MRGIKYLLVSHIPFAEEGRSFLIDRLWAEDLKGLVVGVGPVTVAAPAVSVKDLKSWGPGVCPVSSEDGISFVALPLHRGRYDLTFSARTRAALRKSVECCDIVHTSNLFSPYTALYYAHDLAVKLRKKTLFVVAEDFFDMLNWEWVRTAPNPLQKFRRGRNLRWLDRQVRKRVSSASLAFLHTPAAVARYRDFARNAVAIRQPVHETGDVIGDQEFEAKCFRMRSGSSLSLAAACRMEPLKGVDFIVRAVALLRQRQIIVKAALYGSGRQLENLKRLTEILGVADVVEFPGNLSQGAELQQALRKADLFLMPHLTTDFGRAFFDAIAAGTPVVAFRSLASQDTVRHGIDGWIAPNADFEGLASAISLFDADRELLVRCAAAARERAMVNTKTHWHQIRGQMIRELLESSAGLP